MSERKNEMEDIFIDGKDTTLLAHQPDVSFRLYQMAGQLYAACGVGSWCFRLNGRLARESFPSFKEFLLFFQIGGCLDYMVSHGREINGPMMLTDPLDLVWLAEHVEESGMFIVIGPMFSSRSSVQNLEALLRQQDVSYALRTNLLSKLEKVPVLSQANIEQFARMLHYTVYGEYLENGRIHMQISENLTRSREVPVEDPANPELTRSAEKMILQVIREGDIHGRPIVARAMSYMAEMGGGTREPRRDMKNRMIIFAALCSRAAMDGGLAAQIAAQMENDYIQRFEKCGSMVDLINLYGIMLKDFATRVHICRENPQVSQEIQRCCAYIQAHLQEPLELEDIAGNVGYTGYYLTKKFRKEMGVRMVDYIKDARMEQAKLMLMTDASIQDISDALQYSSRGYFSKVFKNTVGMTPVDYRRCHGKEEAKA